MLLSPSFFLCPSHPCSCGLGCFSQTSAVQNLTPRVRHVRLWGPQSCIIVTPAHNLQMFLFSLNPYIISLPKKFHVLPLHLVEATLPCSHPSHGLFPRSQWEFVIIFLPSF
jgi:hypothetical protein